MLLTIKAIDLPNWSYGTDVVLRFRPTKNFQPKIDLIGGNVPPDVIEISNWISFVCPVVSGELKVPAVQLHTTTDSEVGDNVRYIAEFYNPVKKQRIASFFVNNFKLDPALSVESGVLVQPEWRAVAAFNRLYKRSNRAGLNIDLSDYLTENAIIALIESYINGLGTTYYTENEINTLLANLTNSLTTLISNVSLSGNYYTKGEVDTLLNTTVNNLFNGINPLVTTFNKTTINSMFAQYTTSAALEANFYSKTQVDTLLQAAVVVEDTKFTAYYTAAQVISLLTSTLTNYFTEAETNTQIANALLPYYTKVQIDALFESFAAQKVQEVVYAQVSPSIDLNELYYLTLPFGKTCHISEFSSDTPVRIRVYQTSAERLADSTRAVSSSTPTPAGIGIVAEVVLTASKLTQRMSPAATYVNADSPRNPNAYIIVQKQTVGAGIVGLTFKVIKVEI